MTNWWRAHLSITLHFCRQYGQRSLCKSRKAQNREWAEKEMPNAESDRTRSSVLIFFQKKKTTNLRLRPVNLLIQPIFREHLSCAGVLCLLLWLETWKGRNGLPSQVCCIIIIPCLTSIFLQMISRVYRLCLHSCGFLGSFKYLTMSELFLIALNSSYNSYSKIVTGKNWPPCPQLPYSYNLNGEYSSLSIWHFNCSSLKRWKCCLYLWESFFFFFWESCAEC